MSGRINLILMKGRRLPCHVPSSVMNSKKDHRDNDHDESDQENYRDPATATYYHLAVACYK